MSIRPETTCTYQNYIVTAYLFILFICWVTYYMPYIVVYIHALYYYL